MTPAPTIHANCVAVGERGVLIRGGSGAGKSSLSAALVREASARGAFARLVADDRTRVRASHGRLIASAPPQIAGLMERRGIGIVAAPFLRAVVLALVIEIEAAAERLPDEAATLCEIEGVTLARLAVGCGDPHAASLALDRLAPPARVDALWPFRACVRAAT